VLLKESQQPEPATPADVTVVRKHPLILVLFGG
jgi:hypothetical protein